MTRTPWTIIRLQKYSNMPPQPSNFEAIAILNANYWLSFDTVLKEENIH